MISRIRDIISTLHELVKISGKDSCKSKYNKLSWLSFCGKDMRQEQEKAELKFRKEAVIVLASCLILMLIAYFTSGSGRTPADQLIRDGYGGEDREITINVSANYDGSKVEKSMDLTVKPANLTAEEASLLFNSCEEYLCSEVISSDEISADLSLPELSPDGLVEINWHSSDPARIAEDGSVNLLNLTEACYVCLTASLRAGDYNKECEFIIEVTDGNAEKSMERRLDVLADSLSSDDSGGRLDLPDEVDGMNLLWNFPGREMPWIIVFLGMFIVLALYFGRFDSGEKEMKKLALEFESEIPSMTLQLILLLNAGLILPAAFDELIEKNRDSGKTLYTCLFNVREKAAGENLPFVSELFVFANSTGCRNFIRLASLLLDHSSRGNELADKLERERALLWSSRLSMAKARTKEAETKLCLPLMLLLIVLVVISAAPALMTM